MDAISYTAVRANLSKTMQKVCADHAPVIITRKNEAAVVIMSLEDYQAMEEPLTFCAHRQTPDIYLNLLPNLKQEMVLKRHCLNETNFFQ